ncbi:glycosyltransferase family 4 protein [Acidithiobacillus sp. IBUN Pt1247-S3]
MKVLFNLQSLSPPRTGIGLYTQHLIEALAATGEIDTLAGFLGGRILEGEAFATLLRTEPSAGATSSRKGTSKLRAIKSMVRRIPGAYPVRQALLEWQNQRHIAKLAKTGLIYHEPNYIPVRYDGPLVITAHDLSQVRHPEFHPPQRAAFLNKHLGPALHRADQVITDSVFSANEIMDVYQISAEKITVTHLGAANIFRPRTALETDKTLQDLGLRYRGFVLFVATLEPRKNILRLIDAHSALSASLRKEYPLVLTGAAGWQDSDILHKVKAAEERGETIRTGYLPIEQLADLFSAAAVFCYPSLYEGFGLPVLEGFASGTPVLTSNITSMPEISAKAAIEIDPYSVEAITHGLQTLLEDHALADKHRQAGLLRSQDFSWRNCAEKTLEVYKRLSPSARG